MKVEVLCFGVLKDLLGAGSQTLILPSGASVADVVAAMRGSRAPESPVWQTLAAAVNREYASLATALHDGDEVALLPPVSGGSVAYGEPDAR